MKQYKIIDSLVGHLRLVAESNCLVGVLWGFENFDRVRFGEMKEDLNHEVLLKTEKQLEEYFLHKRKIFDLPLKMAGTPFQQKVWEALLKIPYGNTCSYKEIAEQIGHLAAFRAVGTAIGKNPLSIVVPCHRVIASNGGLAGFAGGLANKKRLLDLELTKK